MFEVDIKKKMIFNKTKSGAAYYQIDGYIVKGGKLVKVYEKTTDYSSIGATNDNPKVTTKKLINGKWKTVRNERKKKND